MIKNIVFDIGRVLINFEPEAYLKGIFDEENLIKEVHKIIFESEEWKKLDRGVICEREAEEAFCLRNPKYDVHIKKAMKGWHSMLTPISDTVEVLKELKKKGYKLYALSNYHREAFKATYENNSFFRLLDGRVISYEINKLKPEREIYEALIEKYKLVPEETLFIDDTKANILGAKNAGIHGIIFTGAKELRCELCKMGIM